MIIDEAQTIYPDRADFKLEHLDRVPPPNSDYLPFPLDDLTNSIPEGRPHDIRTAFDKQRHYNWDIFLTTTNIGKIKSDIRQSSEWAYRHRSLSEISRFFNGQWYEHQHDTENNGKAESHRQGSAKRYKADKRVFNCYRSTATGEHIASNAGTKVFSEVASSLNSPLSYSPFLALFTRFTRVPNNKPQNLLISLLVKLCLVISKIFLKLLIALCVLLLLSKWRLFLFHL